MNNAIYRAWYSLDGESIEYVKVVACSRQQAKKILDLFIKRYIGGADVDRSPLPDYVGHARVWEWGSVHGGTDCEPCR